MSTKRLSIALVAFGLFSGSVAADETYQLVKIWPEAPQGWHFFKLNGVAVDRSGNVYIGDSGNYKVKKFDSEGRFITQWGSPGQGNGQFNTICSIKVDGAGIVYVFDNDWSAGEGRIQKFTAYGQFIGTLERKAPDADKIKYPIDLAIDNEENILVLAVDYRPKENRTYGVRIEKYSPKGVFISQWGAEAGSGDGQFQRPGAIAIDTEDNVYITEWSNGRVQKFDSSGKFLEKWGALGMDNGFFGGGARSIVIDEAGEIYVLDLESVQKFTTGGEFLARWKIPGDQARRLAMDSRSNIYVTFLNSHAVIKLDSNGKVISQWACAGTGDGLFNQPGSIAASPSGHIFVADLWNYRIQGFDSEGRFVSTWGTEFSFELEALAVDARGNLYVACGGSDEVQKFDPEGKLICRWGGTGNGDGQFIDPSAVAFDPSGNVYVAEWTNNRVQKFTSDGKFIAKWGTEGTGNGQFKNPFFIAVDDSDNVWVGDQHKWIGDQQSNGQHRMQQFDSEGKFLKSWTKKVMRSLRGIVYDQGIAVDSSGNSYYAFNDRIEKYDAEGNFISNYAQEAFAQDKSGEIRGLCVDRAGNLCVADSVGTVMQFDANGNLKNKWTSEELKGYGIRNPRPIATDESGCVYVAYYLGQLIYKFSSKGEPLTKFRIAPPIHWNGFAELGGLTVDSSGNIYAVDSVDLNWEWSLPVIQKLNSNSEFVATWDLLKAAEGKIKYPAFIAVDGSSQAYVTDKSNHCVHKLDAQGGYIKSLGEKGTADGQFDTPEGIAVDGAGYVYVCDRQNSRIQKFDSDGKFLTKWGKEGSGDGEFHFPAAVAVDKEGNVFIADSDNHRVQKFTANGKFLTKWGEFGEGPGQFSVPLGIAVDGDGNVYVSDSHNHRIQKFAPVQ